MSIVYVNSKLYLKDAVDFTQYIMNIEADSENYKLITIIGEEHQKKLKCNIGSDKLISIEEFILRTPDIKTKIILETPEEFKDTINSYNIQNILKTLRESNPEKIKNISTVYLDNRYLFVDINYIYWLYNETDKIIYLSNDVIIKEYITPFYEKIATLSRYYKDDKYDNLVNIMYNNYLPNVGKMFDNLHILISNNWDKMNIESKTKTIKDIKDVWMKVCDFYVLRELFKINDIQEYIILIGNMHSNNINKYFKDVLCQPIEYKTHFCEIVEPKLLKYSEKPELYNCISLNNVTKIILKDDDKYRKPNFDICRKRNAVKIFGGEG